MYTAHFIIVYVSWLCVTKAQVHYHQTNQGAGITSIVGFTPPANVDYIKFYMNAISHVPAGYFVNMSSLDGIWLQKNVISFIDDNAFSGVPTLWELRLHDNDLTVIRTLTFAGLPNLRDLELEVNHIHTIQAGAFHDLTSLSWLNLRDNALQTLSQCIFDLANPPTALNSFYIYNNPLECNSSLCWLQYINGDWMMLYSTGLTECAGPAPLTSRTWNTLTIEELGCIPSGQ